jgi:pilus assembly protein CpaC
MQRHLSKSFGFKPFLTVGKNGGNPSGFALSTLDPTNLGNFALAVGRVVSGNFAFSEALDALEEKGAVKILAEPNLVAMSGDTANFLAGGEFPIPVSQSTSGGVPTVTVEFKPFGISLAFTPTVVDSDLINLIVAPEVSQIDKTNSVSFSGFVIPGIQTRRAKTTVELRDGQSFAIAGLLSSNFTDTMRGIPGLMDIPIFGALARSSDYVRNETELVIIVTPKLVQPASAGTLVAPTDSFVPPSDAAIFLMGKPENPDSGLSPRGGGLTGKYGHIIR